NQGEACIHQIVTAAALPALAAALLFTSASASANPFELFPFARPQAPQVMAYAPVETDEAAEVPARFRRQVVNYATNEAPGTIIVDTPNTYLYFVLGNGRAVRYGIGVGREGFTWTGIKHIEQMAEW